MKILLIDGSNYLHRGHWAIVGTAGRKEKLETKDGFPTSGIKGMLNMVLTDLQLLKPDRLIVCHDVSSRELWRSKLYPEYKRSPARVAAKQKAKDTGNNVYEQLEPLQKMLHYMGIRQARTEGEEADDLIGTLATEFAADGHRVLISSSDKDFGSIVSSRIKLVEAKTRTILGPTQVKKKFGVAPEQMVEYLMLVGDAVDNIPGVVKCGPTTACKWLDKYGSIKNLLENEAELTPVLRANLAVARKKFKLTRVLLTIKTTVSHTVTLENSEMQPADYGRLERLCTRLEMKQAHSAILRMLERGSKWTS